MADEKDTNTDDTNHDNDAPESGARGKGKPVIAPSRTGLEEFSELLHQFDTNDDNDDDDEGNDDDESHEDGDTKPAKSKKPKNLDELAEALGVKVADLYKIEIPSSRNGEKPFSLGQLKDLMKERDDFQISNLKLEDDRRAFEREKVAAQQELEEMLTAIPADQLKPEAMAKMRKILDGKRAKGRREVLEAIPSWNDPVARESELKAISEHLGGYGLRGEVLLAHMEAGWMRYFRDNYRRESMVAKALAAVEERRNKAKGPGARKDSGKPKAKAGKDSAGRLEGAVTDFRNAFSDRRH